LDERVLLLGCDCVAVAGWIVARPEVLAQATQPRLGETCRNWFELALELSLRRRAFVWARHNRAQEREARLREDEWRVWGTFRDGNEVGWGWVSLSHTYPCKNNSSPSPYPNPTGIKLLSHPHPHRVTGVISYPYPYPFSYYFNINFN